MTIPLLNAVVAIGSLLSTFSLGLRYRRLKDRYALQGGILNFLNAIIFFVFSLISLHISHPLHGMQYFIGISFIAFWGCIVIGYFLREMWLAFLRHYEKTSYERTN